MLRDQVWFHPLRYAIKSLAKNPSFSATVVLPMALGLGALTAIFGIFFLVLLRPLPFPQAERIHLVSLENEAQNLSGGFLSMPDFLDLQRRNRTFERLAAISQETFVLAQEETVERIPGARVTADFFQVFNLPPFRGRVAMQEWRDASQKQAVVSYGFWQSRLGGTPDAVGRLLRLDGEEYLITAVAARGIDFPQETRIWLPLDVQSMAQVRAARYLLAAGRLAEGVPLSEAQSDLTAISLQLAAEYPDTNEGFTASASSLRDHLVGDMRGGLYLVLAAAVFVLLIVCTNVAALLLARGSVRSDEMWLRRALGATRLQVLGQLVTESLLLSLAGGMAGLLLGWLGGRLLIALYPHQFPWADPFGFHWQIAAFVLAAAAGAGLLAGIIPSLQISSTQAKASRGAVGNSSEQGARRTQSAILVLQIGITLALLVAAGLMTNSLYRLISVNPGFRSDGALTARIALPNSRYREATHRRNFFQTLLENLGDHAQVESLAATTSLPLSGTNMKFGFELPRRPDSGEEMHAHYRAVSGGLFRTLGTRLLAGREFGPGDRSDSRPVAIVNQAFAKQYFSGESPLRQPIKLTYGERETRTIVGLVADIRHQGLNRSAEPEVYVPFPQHPWRFMHLVIRSAQGDPSRLIPMLRSEVHALDPAQPIDRIEELEAILARSIGEPRFYSALLASFAALAFLIAMAGIYGMNRYWVQLRAGEVGVRMALGASPGSISKMLLGKTVRVALLGLALGIGLALFISRFLQGLLYGITAYDPLTFISMALLLLLTALAAAYWPARRASATDPSTILRNEQ